MQLIFDESLCSGLEQILKARRTRRKGGVLLVGAEDFTTGGCCGGGGGGGAASDHRVQIPIILHLLCFFLLCCEETKEGADFLTWGEREREEWTVANEWRKQTILCLEREILVSLTRNVEWWWAEMGNSDWCSYSVVCGLTLKNVKRKLWKCLRVFSCLIASRDTWEVWAGGALADTKKRRQGTWEGRSSQCSCVCCTRLSCGYVYFFWHFWAQFFFFFLNPKFKYYY